MSTTYLPASGYVAYYQTDDHTSSVALPVVAVQRGPIQPGGGDTVAMVLDRKGRLVQVDQLPAWKFMFVAGASACACS